MFQHLNLFSSLGWKVGSWWPGVVLAILGSIANNIGTNVMKLAINRRQQLSPDARPRLTRYPMWSSGFALFTLGTAMSFGAFKFAAQSLLSSLASVQFLSQVFFSRFVLHERIEKYAYVGVALIISGCICIVIFGAHGTKNYRPEELAALYGRSEYVCYMLGAGFCACVVSLLYTSMKQRIMRQHNIGRFDIARASIRQRQILAVFFSIKSALFGTQAVVLAKSLSMLLIQALHPNPAYSNPLFSYQTYFILLGFIAAATFWVTRLNHGLRLFEAVYLVPMMQICWILFSTIAGGIYYEEFIEFGRKEYGAYALGFLCVLIGVALLCPRDDAKSLNAADVIYEIVSDENPLLRGNLNNEDEGQGDLNGDDDDDPENRSSQRRNETVPPSKRSDQNYDKASKFAPYDEQDDIEYGRNNARDHDHDRDQSSIVVYEHKNSHPRSPNTQQDREQYHHHHSSYPHDHQTNHVSQQQHQHQQRQNDDYYAATNGHSYSPHRRNSNDSNSPLPPSQPPLHSPRRNHDTSTPSPRQLHQQEQQQYPRNSSNNNSSVRSPRHQENDMSVAHLDESGDIGSRVAITPPPLDRR